MSTPSTSVRRSLRTKTPVKYNCANERTPTKRGHYDDSPPSPVEVMDDIEDAAYPNADIATAETKFRRLVMFDEEDVAGSNVYSFKTPKKKDAMATIAANTPKTPKATVHTPKTPKSAMKTPKVVVGKHLLTESLSCKTPSHIRTATKIAITRKHFESKEDFSSDSENDEYRPSSSGSSCSAESSDASAESDQSINEQTPSPLRRPIKMVGKTSNTRSRNREDLVLESDGYFANHTSKKVITSDHTLDRLKTPRLPHEDLFRMLAAMKLSAEHERSVTSLNKQYEQFFDKWMFILNENFSILLFGLGSKRNLLELFHQKMLRKEMVVVVNGFFPGLTIKEILDSIANDILDMSTESRNIHETVDAIDEEVTRTGIHVFLIVHNIDGVMLRNHNAQLCLSRLAKIRNVHLLASIDHINTPFLWDYTKLNNFNFSWWDASTLLPYINETAYENSMLVQNSGSLALSSIRNVFLSLASNSRNVYLLIIKYQIANKQHSFYQGMPSEELYRKCRESFLASSTSTYRAQLTEFLDHRLLKTKRTADGAEHLTIPLETELLKQFLNEQVEN